MKAASYYARTEKGAAEVAQRSQAIPARARSLLLMIDGKSTGAQLIEKLAAFPNSGELLQLLETEGYIGPVDGAASGAAPAPAPAPMPAAAGAMPATPQAASPGTGSGAGVGAAKRFMIRSLHEVFGPDADSLTGKVELAQTPEDLRKLAERHRELMASMGSRRKADAYWQGIEEMLPAP
jgi:hypothetical protein